MMVMDVQPSKLEQGLSCPVCQDIYQDPVFLLCSHSFCRACLQHSWREKEKHECPMCRAHFAMDLLLPSNLVLKNLCDDYLQDRGKRREMGMDAEAQCSLHGEKLKLFCLEDKQLACMVCRDSKKHANHKFCPLDEAAQDLKEELKTLLKPLKDNLTTFEGMKDTLNQNVKYLKSQARHTELQIKEEFQSLYRFLHTEETARLTALKEEEEQKSYMLMKRTQEIGYLVETIHTLEMETKMPDILFLQNYNSTIVRAKCTMPNLGRVPGKSIDVARHLGNLKYVVWEKMQKIIEYTPVTLDPNTAHPCLNLSSDLTSLQLCTEIQHLAESPESFDGYTCVLGSEGFASGRHQWEVEVGDCSTWAMGVISESQNKLRQQLSRCSLWYIGCANGKFGKGCTTELLTPLTVEDRPRRVRVELDWDGGQVSFSDAATETQLYTFTDTFTEPLFPYFCNVSSTEPLQIVSVKPTVRL